MSTIKAELERVAPIPHKKRVWMYLKDHPRSTATKIASVFKDEPKRVSHSLGAMYQRGMIERNLEVRRDGRHEYNYTVPVKHKEFELFPLPAKVKAVSVKADALDVPAVPAKLPAPEQQQTESATFDIEQLTIAEAKALYKKLHKMFG